MCRSCRIVAQVHTWQCGLLPPFPYHLYLAFLPILPLLNLPTPYCPSPKPHQQIPVCDAPLPASMWSHCSTPTYECEHVVFDFLFLYQFAENDGFQIHPCPYKGHVFIIFYGCIVFHGVYVPHFSCPVYHRWAFGLVPGQAQTVPPWTYMCMCLCYVIHRFIILWIYTQ